MWIHIWSEESIEVMEANGQCHVVCRFPPHWTISETINAVALSDLNGIDSCGLKRMAAVNQ